MLKVVASCINTQLRTSNHIDYFLWGHLKSTVYESNPHTIQELKDISNAVAAIKITMLHRV